MNKKLPLLLLLLLSLPSYAQEREVDLRHLLPAIRSQGRIGNCYAQTSADLQTAFLRAQGSLLLKARPQAFVSPNANSFCTKYSSLQKKFVGAKGRRDQLSDPDYVKKIHELTSLAETIRTTAPFSEESPKLNEKFSAICKELGYSFSKCSSLYLWPESLVNPEKKKGYLLTYSARDLDGAHILDSIDSTIRECGICLQEAYDEQDTSLLSEFESLLDDFTQNKIDFSKEICSFQSLETVSPDARSSMQNIILALQENSLQEHPAIAFYKKSCLKDPVTFQIQERVVDKKIDPKKKEASIAEISALLKMNTPVGISFYSDFLFAKSDPGLHSRHAVSIVGQKFKGKKKLFVIRNSWGDKACEKELRKSSRLRFTCDKGDYVIDARLLISKTYNLTYIK
jgi:hypothetical protein